MRSESYHFEEEEEEAVYTRIINGNTYDFMIDYINVLENYVDVNVIIYVQLHDQKIKLKKPNIQIDNNAKTINIKNYFPNNDDSTLLIKEMVTLVLDECGLPDISTFTLI